MLIEVSGVRDGDHWPPKDGILTVSDAEGADLIRQGFAEAIASAPAMPKVEKATPRKAAEKRA